MLRTVIILTDGRSDDKKAWLLIQLSASASIISCVLLSGSTICASLHKFYTSTIWFNYLPQPPYGENMS